MTASRDPLHAARRRAARYPALPALLAFPALLSAAMAVSSCRLWGGFDNPGDPGAKGYQGYDTVAAPEDIRIVSPSPGDALREPTLVLTKVASAKRYGARIWASADMDPSALVFEKLDYPGNVLDLSSSAIEDSTTYFVKAGAMPDSGAWGWSPASSVATRWSATAAAPVLSPPEGTYNSNQAVAMSTATAGAAIHYTTDGSTPGKASPIYDPAAPVEVAGHGTTRTIKAVAIRTGMAASAVASSTYAIDWYQVSEPRFSLADGTYDADQSVTIACPTKGATIYYAASSTGPPPDPTTSSAVFGADSPILVAGHGASIRIKARAVMAGMTNSKVTSAAYAISYPALAAPTFDPPGGTYPSDQSVAIVRPSADATIYYTTNGDQPTSGSSVYSDPIPVRGHGAVLTLRAIASAPKRATSSEGSQSYLISYPPAEAPIFSPPGGAYTTSQSVSITSSTAGATVYYTTSAGGVPADPTLSSSILAPGGTIAVSPSSSTTIKAAAIANGYSLSPVSTAFYCTPLLAMVPVTGGTFNNGTSDVTVSTFAMSETEITQAQYRAVTGVNPSGHAGNTYPVELVSWFDAVEFCNKLSAREGLQAAYVISDRSPAAGYPVTGATVVLDRTKTGYRLPTEAEWEFAARGGASTHNYAFAGSDNLAAVAWYYANSSSATQAVRQKAPNELGLYDMTGNVKEWCWDWYYISYPSGPQSDPTGPDSGSDRVARGGAFNDGYSIYTDTLKVGYRDELAPSLFGTIVGFRVVRTVP